MNYCNSSAYVQRQTNRLLRPFKGFIKDYVNDIVIFSKSLTEHVRHLRQVFSLFKRVNVMLKTIKFFLDYLDVQLLSQRVDFFNLSTSKKRLEVINKLKFSLTLAALETYFDIIDYLRSYIVWYAQIIRSL